MDKYCVAGIASTVVLAGMFAPMTAAASPGQAIAVGAGHACALTPAKTVKCWGDDSSGQLGDNGTTTRLTPVDVVGLGTEVVSISAGATHNCVVTAQGGAKCWGGNDHGQLGDGTKSDRGAPVDVAGLASGVASISAGLSHSCAVTTSGGAKCWGSNAAGQLGDGTMNDAVAPVDVVGLQSNVVGIATSVRNSCAVTSEGAIKCWGYDGVVEVNCREQGQICIPDWWGHPQCSPITVCDYQPHYRPYPATLRGMESGFSAVTMAGGSVCGVSPQGIASCTDVLGYTGVREQPGPVEGVSAIAMGAGHNCLLSTAQRVYCTGMNEYGELGDGTTAYSYPAVAVRGLPGDIVGIAASGYSNCAISASGEAFCWGMNGYGQLGDGTTVTRRSAVNVVGLDAAPWPGGLTGLWWNAAESGWGLYVDQQGDILFGVLFAYDASGRPMWLVMSDGEKQPGTPTFAGGLYRATGSPFDSNPFVPVTPQDMTQVGTMSIEPRTANSARLTYTVNGVLVAKTIEKQVFGSRPAYCANRTGDRKGSINYQDLWWNPTESGWGIGLTHQDDILFATLFTYDAGHRNLWLVMSNGRLQADGTYAGELYQAVGPPFNAQPFVPITPANMTKVGTMTLSFSDGETGTLTYSVNGSTVSKQMTRQVFSSPVPACN